MPDLSVVERQFQPLNRLFEQTSMEVDHKRLGAVLIRCVCGKTDITRAATMKSMAGGNMDREVLILSRRFEHMGWEIGKTRNHHRCPDCIAKSKEKPVKTTDRPTLHPAAPFRAAALAQPGSTVVKLGAEQPRQMGRDDRRVIFEKLNEVYDKDCYASPWTDAAVAKDLGTPLAWVKQVREEMFGPEGSNADIEKLANEANGIAEQMRKMDAQLTAASRDMGTLLVTAEALRKQAEDVEKRLRQVRDALH